MRFFAIFAFCFFGSQASADDLASLKPIFGGFIDAYYAVSSLNPPSIDRQYTSQAVRNNEFNINLAYVDAKIASDRVHGRLALQAGTSVEENYANEPTIGKYSGDSLTRNLQEAYTGYRIADGTWIDAGIMFSHLGLEDFVSKDNATYTRSLVADFSPYYQSGLRLTHEFSPQVSAQFLVLNGWQNISESNPSKAIGTQISYQVTEALNLSYNTFFGNENGFRQFHDLVFKYTISPNWSFSGEADVGFQTLSSLNASNHTVSWYGFTAIARYALTTVDAFIFRLERYDDSNNVLVATPNGDPFRAWGYSIGYDWNLSTQLVWRNEAREILADHNVYVSRTGSANSEIAAVSSLALSF